MMQNKTFSKTMKSSQSRHKNRILLEVHRKKGIEIRKKIDESIDKDDPKY